MKTVSEFPCKVVDHPDVGIVMPDGVRLSARIWMPEGATENPVPAVLEYIPYRKRDGTLPRDERMHPYFAGHGYAAVRVDIRGNGDSEGLMTDEYSEQELADAVEVIRWLAEQPWCSGAVGMMGKSWGGFNCLQTAFLRPPALRAVISVCSTTDRFADDIHFKGGCLLGENMGWGAVMLSYSSRPADPALRPDWREDWMRRLDAEPFLAPRWASHQARDAYWKHGSVCEDWQAIQVPVLSVGGWADNYMNTVGHLMANLSVPVQGLMGPWVHQYPHQAVPGPAIGFLQEAVRWWDCWLKGVQNGVAEGPRLRAYMLDSEAPDASIAHRKGHWVTEAAWPSPRVRDEVLELAPGGAFGGVLGGRAAPMEVRLKTPQDLGFAAGEFFPMGLNAELPGDQSGDDAMSVCFDTAALAEPLALLGQPRLRLRLQSDRPRAFVVARLCDVAPDGRSVRICHGMLNLCHRDSMETPSDVPVGVPFDAEVTLDLCGYRLAAGHRLRIALSTTYWPFLWPSPEEAELTILEGRLHLPVHPGVVADEWQPPAPEAAPAWRHRVVAAGSSARRIERDLLSGRTSLVVEDHGGLAENLTHGLINGHAMVERFSIEPGNPLSAKTEIEWTEHFERDGWKVVTRSSSTMTATREALLFTGRLEAYEGEKLVFARDYSESVPRRFV
ncbi:CocE/NonD family hydrolase [Aliigemmobacter aestuarii]|uniref:CocE/NonD family hydrolase n=1 Tax=Aliigemmobacter aestuarii TaxID=1445661 RepID=A0A4S3MQQ6_9RHOB|nr:CocE/NonD family hydrolase [Gemmobacter aestuarii]THD84870.1 CocE/NonD family hydrolase [Gemmobacter aestuarii]